MRKMIKNLHEAPVLIPIGNEFYKFLKNHGQNPFRKNRLD